MKLRNKKTGEVITTYPANFVVNSGERIKQYRSLAELNDEWEDVSEEPKEYWYVSCGGRALKATPDEDDYNESHNSGHKAIGNWFATEEAAENAVKKLKAWQRLKDSGFRIRSFYTEDSAIVIRGGSDIASNVEMWKDLDLLFGEGEE